jgi:hypothetical protein
MVAAARHRVGGVLVERPQRSEDERPGGRQAVAQDLPMGGGLHVQGVAIAPAHLLRSALGYDRVLSDAEVELLATTA